MQNLQKENQLLKDYVVSLQKQNQARNSEKNTLFHQIDRLTAEVDRLNALKNSRVITTLNGNSDQEIKKLNQRITSLQKEIDSLKTLNTQLTVDLRTKSNENLVLTQEQQRLNLQIKTLKESNTTNNRILLLQNEINSNRVKLSQISVLQEKIRVTNIRVVQLEALNKRLQSDYKRVQSDLRRQQTQSKRLENQNKELKMNNKSSIQISGLLSSKLSLQATVRQLNNKIQWLQSNNKSSQQQKLSLQKRIKDLERQVLQARGKFTQLRFSEQSLKSLEASLSIKDKEMEALEQMIGSLKQNKKYLQKALRQKEDIIVTLESQLSHTKVSHNQHYQRRIDEITAHNHQLESSLSVQIKNNQDLQAQIRLMRGDREKMEKDITMLSNQLQQAQNQIKTLKRKTTEYSTTTQDQYFKFIPQRERNNDDLRLVVSELKQQLQELKSSQFKSQVALKNPHHCETCHHAHLRNHLQKQRKSPHKTHSKIPVSNQRDRSPFKKAKWDDLQKKINTLRNENQTLKKSLFE